MGKEEKLNTGIFPVWMTRNTISLSLSEERFEYTFTSWYGFNCIVRTLLMSCPEMALYLFDLPLKNQ